MNRVIDVSLLDGVIKKTVLAVEESKQEIFEIAETARRESESLKREIHRMRDEIAAVIVQVDDLENRFMQSRQRLVQVSSDFQSFTEADIRLAYEEAHLVQVELSLAREREKNLRRLRDELEQRLRSLEATIVRAEGLLTQMGVILGYLTGELSAIGEVLETAKQRQMLGLKVIQAQEEERKRVAREIHDGPAQSMAHVVLMTELVERMLEQGQLLEAKRELQELKETVRTSLSEVRRIIFDLRPMALDDLGLTPTLQKYIQKFEERTGIHVDFVVFGKEQKLESSYKAALFRLVQECLTNVAKHSRATRVQVKLEFQAESVYLVVKDNGKGFDVDRIRQRGQTFGIMGMRERIELLEGKMEVTSAPGQGTRVLFHIPLKS